LIGLDSVLRESRAVEGIEARDSWCIKYKSYGANNSFVFPSPRAGESHATCLPNLEFLVANSDCCSLVVYETSGAILA